MTGRETVIGTNKRYARHYDRLIDQRILEREVQEAGPLQSLSAEELSLASEPLTIDPEPKPVRVWVRFGSKPFLVEGEAFRWTPDAVAVRFMIRETPYRTWVWSSAVTALPRRRPPETS